MTPNQHFFKARTTAACVVFLLAGNSAPALAGAANGGNTLQPSALAQIKAILDEKASRTPTEAKLESNLLYGVKALTQSATKGSLQAQPRFVQDFVKNNIAADLTVKVTITAKVTDGLLAALKAVGASDISPFPQYDTVTATVPADQLLTISTRPEVRFIRTGDPNSTNRYDLTPSELQAWQQSNGGFDGLLTGPITNVGAATSQGVVAHAADKVQQTGIDGTGVKVCVLSNGVNSLAARQATGDLPASVDVLTGQAGSGDEGTAMLEIVHDIAPGAALGFATANPSQAQFATNIQNLRNAPHNCNIIVDDVTYYAEPPFQEGIIAQAVTTVTTSGAPYFSSAANSGSLAKGTSGTWEGDFVSGGNFTLPDGSEAGTIHKFGASTSNTLTSTGNLYILTWGDPQSGSNNDYDLFILNSALTTVLGASASSQTGTQIPLEAIAPSASIPAGSKIIVLNYNGAAAVRALRLDTERGRLSINTKGNTFGHNGGVNTITTATVNVGNAGGGVFTGGAANPVSTYSSDGPRRLFYTPAGAAITPGNILFGTNGGTLLNKVDLTSTDCVTTTTPGFAPFCGTSAAAPHAAAIAALIKSAKPSLTVAQIKSALTTTALDIETAGFDVTSGSGLIMANTSVRSVLTPIGAAKVFAPASITVGGTSTLTLTLTNSNAVALKNVALTDTYPSANVKNAATPAAAFTGTGCAGTVTAVAGGSSVALSAATIPAGGSCVLKVNVTSAVAGSYVDGSGSLTTPLGLNTAAASSTLTVAAAVAKPDFVVTSVVLSPASPTLKGTFSATVTVKNQGTAAGNGGYLDVWTNQPVAQTCPADGNGFALVGTLAAGASKTLVITGLPSGADGAKTLRAFVDSACLTAESNESNNQFTQAYTVVGGPDFVVTGIVLSPASPKTKTTFSATVTVKNQGTAAGDGRFLDVWANQSAVQTCPADGDNFAAVGVLAAGASKAITLTGIPAGAVGAKTLRAFVDSYCETVESNDGNNQATASYSVVP